MPVYPGDFKPKVKQVCFFDSSGYNSNELHISAHLGTHVDFPFHMLNNGLSQSNYAIDWFIGKALLIPCLGEKELLPEHYLRAIEGKKKPEFALFYTGWSKAWGQATYYENFPFFSESLAHLLAKEKLKGIGMDFPSADPVDSENFPNHKAILKSNAILIENLKNLKALSQIEGLFTFSCLPLKIENGDGSPTRAVAMLLNP